MNSLETEEIKKLSEMPVGDDYVITLYLKLDPADRENFKYKITLKNLIQKTRESLEEGRFTREQLKSIDSDLQRIEEFFNDTERISSCSGVALFCSGPNEIMEFFKLPYVFRNRLVVEKYPLVGELLKIKEETEAVPFVIIDRKKARLFNVTFDNAEEVHDYIYPGASRTQKFQSGEGTFKQRVSTGSGRVSMGYGEYNFNRTIENDYHQHLKYVSDRVFDLYKENRFENLIIGGNEQIIKDFIPHLHSYVNEKVLGTVVLDVDVIKNDELIDHTMKLLEQKKKETEDKAVSEFEEKNAHSLSLSGLEPSLRALAKGQVKTLLIEEGFAHSGYVCPDSGILTLSKDGNHCPENKTPVKVADIMDLAMEDALDQKSEVVIVRKELAKKVFNGVGVILRFRL